MNRVLFKAAAIVNIAAAALIYVACSGDDGKDGPPGPAGANCTVAESTTVPGGIDVICGSDRKTLGPGPAGAPGQNGQGVPADGCYLSSVAGGYNVICGGINQGPLSTGGGGGPGGGCTITENDLYININCGTGNVANFAKAWCFYVDQQTNADVSRPYDPINGSCTSEGIRNNCDEVAYDALTQFCALAKAGDAKKTVFARCGADYDDETGELIPTKTGSYDPTTEFCAKAASTTLNTESGFFAAGTSAGQISGNANLPGEVAKICGPRTGLIQTDLTLNASSGTGVLAAAQAGYAAGRYTTGDFCAADNKIYPKCGSGTTNTYDPVARFCLLANAAASAASKFGTALASGIPTPRCGTESGETDTKSFGFGGAGSYYSDKNFCANNSVSIKCQDYAGTNGTIKTGSGAVLNADASYDVTKYYCELTSGASSSEADYAAALDVLQKCPTGSGTNYNPTTHFCADDGQVYIRCGSSGQGTEAATKYDQTKKFCDNRGRLLPNAITGTLVTTIIYATGGSQLDYATIGTQTWMTKNLAYPTANDTLLDWATATSTTTGCPAGWSVPTNAQWGALVTTVNTASGANTPALLLRTDATANSNLGWWTNNPTAAAVSAIGFNASPTSGTTAAIAATDPLGVAYDLDAAVTPTGVPVIGARTGKYAAWWTKDEDANNAVIGTDKNNAILRWFLDNDVVVRTGSGSKLANKLSVRCIKDNL